MRTGHDPYTNYYYAQVLYALGDNGYAKLFPDTEERLVWSKYRDAYFAWASKTQNEDGSWSGAQWGIGPLFNTAVNLIILQMDNEAVSFIASSPRSR